MLLKKILTFLFCFFIFQFAFSQDSIQKPAFSFSGYVDAYGAMYSDSLGSKEFQKYATVSPRSNQFGLNVAMLTAKYSSKNVRGVITLQYGDIPISSWSGTYNPIQEANVGLRLCNNLWLDAGFFRTNLGTEGLLPKENYTSSLAITTYYESLYQVGARLNYAPSEKLALFVYVLNGYNLYQDNNIEKSAGVLITYAFNDHLNIGYSGYYGDDSENPTPPQFRVENNAFINYKGNKLKITAGGDLVSQKHSWLGDLESSTKWGVAYGGMLIASYQACQKFRVYGRGEFFQDPNGFLTGTFTDNNNNLTGLKVRGATLGVEYKPTEYSYIRLEGRELFADKDQEIFYRKETYSNKRVEAMLNIGFWFE